MSAGHNTGFVLGAAVVTLGAVPFGFGVSEAGAAHLDTWRNGWFLLGVVIWCLGAFLLLTTSGHLAWSWRSRRRGPHIGVKPGARGPGFRTPGIMTGILTTGIGVVLPDGRIRSDAHSPIRPMQPSGSLPLAVDMEGISGNRHGTGQDEVWVWTAEDVAFVNESDDPIGCRVWLVVFVQDLLPVRELHRTPNELVWLEPRGRTHVTLEFRLELALFSDDARLNPGKPKEMVFLEVGSKGRELRLPFPAPGADVVDTPVLSITIDKEARHDVLHDFIVWEIDYSVRNNTDTDMTIHMNGASCFHPTRWAHTNDPQYIQGAGAIERQRRDRDSLPTMVHAGEAVHACYYLQLERPEEGMLPDYVLRVKDGLGRTYEGHPPRTQGRH